MSKLIKGSIHLIIGPMYAGKTTELIRLKNRAEIAGKKCLVIKYQNDTRYDVSKLSTHNLIMIEAISSINNSLKQTMHNIVNLQEYDCVFIDEIQFYKDGANVCDELADAGYEVIVSGLQGDFERKRFECIADLIPHAEKITHLTAIDSTTGEEAAFTARITNEIEQECIGSNEMYLAVDRLHHLKIQKNKVNDLKIQKNKEKNHEII